MYPRILRFFFLFFPVLQFTIVARAENAERRSSESEANDWKKKKKERNTESVKNERKEGSVA